MTDPEDEIDQEPRDGGRPALFHLWWLARTHVGTLPKSTPEWAVPTEYAYRHAQALISMAIRAAARLAEVDTDHYRMPACEMAVAYGRSMLPYPDEALWDSTAVRLGTLQLAGRLAARTVSEELSEDGYLVDIRRAVGGVVGRLWPDTRAAGPSPESFAAGRHLYRMIRESGLSSTELPAGLADLHRAATATGSLHSVALHHMVRAAGTAHSGMQHRPYLPAALLHVLQGAQERVS